MIDTAPQAYFHTLNPFAVHFWGNFGIRWYGLSYLAGFILGYFIIRMMVRKGTSPLSLEQVSDFVFTVALGCVLGGRLGYCIFYSPELFLKLTSHFPFWGVLAVNEGGMASHGGMAGIFIACWYYGKKHNIEMLHLTDLTTLGGTLGVFFGRIANFINGELVGRLCSPDLAWAVKFPQDIYLWPSKEPSRLQGLGDVVRNIGISADSWKEWTGTMLTNAASWNSVQTALARVVDAVQAKNAAVIEGLRPLIDARHPSQLYEALLEGLFLFVLLFVIWRKPQKPGVVTGWFFSAYACVRIVGEQFRMPDAQLGFQWLGLTRGQWLSIVLLCVGVTCLVVWSRAKREKLGGWLNS